MLGSVEFLITRELGSKSAVCKICEKVNLYHESKRLISKSETALSLMESGLLAVMF